MATVTKDFRVKAGLVVEGSTATVNSHDILTEALVDAKGDLLVASAADAVTRLAVGTDNHVLTADSSATNGIAWKAPAAVGVFESSISFEGSTADDYETTLTVTDPTADRTITLPNATGTVVLQDSTDTLTNKSISLTTNTITGTIAEFNTALTDQDFATLAGTETFTNKTLTTPKINENVDLLATSTELNILDGATLSTTELNYVDGVTSAIQTQLNDKASSGDLTTHTGASTGVHGVTGSVVGTSDAQTLTNKILTSPAVDGNGVVFEGATANDFETTLTVVDPTADHTITLPNATGTVALTADVLALAGGTMTGAIAMGTNKITGLGTPTDATDAATKAYVDSAAQGIDWKASVRAATTESVTLASDLENGDTLDGVTLATGDRILVKDQGIMNAVQNGIYVVKASGAPDRSTDADTGSELTASFAVFVEEGTANADSGYVLTTDGAITVGDTPLTFTQFTGLGQVVAGDGLAKTGNTLNVTAGTGISITGDAVTNDGVLSITGTANQISATASTGAITLSTPQDIHSTATPTFTGVNVASVTLADALMGSALATASTSATTIDSWSATTYSSAKYIVQMKKSGNIEVIEVLVTVDGSNNVYLTEYADVISNAVIGTTNAVFDSGNVLLQVTGIDADTSVKVHKIYIEA
jgi:hypothetical protein